MGQMIERVIKIKCCSIKNSTESINLIWQKRKDKEHKLIIWRIKEELLTTDPIGTEMIMV